VVINKLGNCSVNHANHNQALIAVISCPEWRWQASTVGCSLAISCWPDDCVQFLYQASKHLLHEQSVILPNNITWTSWPTWLSCNQTAVIWQSPALIDLIQPANRWRQRISLSVKISNKPICRFNDTYVPQQPKFKQWQNNVFC